MPMIGESISPVLTWWLVIYALTISALLIGALLYYSSRLRRGKRLQWDAYTEYFDISEFSNRNIPLKIIYKNTEFRWLSASYVHLKNIGREPIEGLDTPEKQSIIFGHPDVRYIGFNKLISKKTKVNLSPLFLGQSVFCKIEFDRLGPGDEILCSLLFVADDRHEVDLEGSLFGKNSTIIPGNRKRLRNWRALWWLLVGVILLGIIGGIVMLNIAPNQQSLFGYQFQILLVCYCLALATAAVLLRPVHNWQQILKHFQEEERSSTWERFKRTLRFMLGLSSEI